MKAKTLEKAKELEDDIRAIRMAMTESSNARHFAMLENYAYDARRQNLPKWLTPRIMVVLGEERKRLEHELETLTDDDNEEQTNFAPSLDDIADQMTEMFYSDHNIDDDQDVTYSKKAEAQNEWRKFVNEYFDIPCTIIANWNVGIYDLEEHKWVERYDKKED